MNGGQVEEDFEICGKINQYSIDWAFTNVVNRTLIRFKHFGEELRIGDDIQTLSGPGWSFMRLEYAQECDQSSHRYYTAVNSPYLWLRTYANGCLFIQEQCGVHYCKVLSPAHVMEWLYTDGLRFNLSISNINSTNRNITC
jgi:hypothetical protein